MTQTRTRTIDGVSVQAWHDALRELGPEWQPLRDALSRVPASGILRLHKPGTLRVERRDGMLLGYIDVRRAWWLPSIADKAA